MSKFAFDLEPGRMLGRHYEIVEFLGGGWEGEVYKVEERLTGIMRAAKLFYPRGNSRETPLLKYARKLHRVQSCPIVIQYHHRDTAKIRGKQVDFLVSDFADGEMLSSYLKRQPKKRLPAFEALHLLYSLTLGVEQIHYLGEYHGDIHSDNIMVKRRGLGFDVFLLDFYDLGRTTKDMVLRDVVFMITVLWEMIGEAEGYRRAGPEIKSIVMGRKHSLIRRNFPNAGQLRLALENLEWD